MKTNAFVDKSIETTFCLFADNLLDNKANNEKSSFELFVSNQLKVRINDKSHTFSSITPSTIFNFLFLSLLAFYLTST